jgi:hypothetical protein
MPPRPPGVRPLRTAEWLAAVAVARRCGSSSSPPRRGFPPWDDSHFVTNRAWRGLGGHSLLDADELHKGH